MILLMLQKLKMIIFAELHLPVIVFQHAHTAVQLGGSMNIVVMLVQFNLCFHGKRKKVSACTAALAD